MLSEFIEENRDEVVDRSRARVAKRSAPRPTDEELQKGIPLFVDQLVVSLRERGSSHGPSTPTCSAARIASRRKPTICASVNRPPLFHSSGTDLISPCSLDARSD